MKWPFCQYQGSCKDEPVILKETRTDHTRDFLELLLKIKQQIGGSPCSLNGCLQKEK